MKIIVVVIIIIIINKTKVIPIIIWATAFISDSFRK
jgi:hypothetical protein